MKKTILSAVLLMIICVFFVSCRENTDEPETETSEILNQKQISVDETEISDDAKKMADETKKAGEDALDKAKQMVEEIKKEK